MAVKGPLLAALHKILLNPSDPRDMLNRLDLLNSSQETASRTHQLEAPEHNPVQIEQQKSCVSRVVGLMSMSEEEGGDVKAPDLLADMRLLQWAGVGIGPEETHRLYLSIKKLSEIVDNEVTALRLWGRVSTVRGAYFIVEGLNPEDPPDEADPRLTEGRDGVNKHAYWVSTCPEANPKSWQQLPQVTCEQIVASRVSRRYLTGDLSSDVRCHPPFPGKESAYLRAIIARINGSTAIAPTGFFKYEDEDNPELVVPTDPEERLSRCPAASTSLLMHSNWVRVEREVNSIGRVTALPPLDEGPPDPPVNVAIPLVPILEEEWTIRRAPSNAAATISSPVVARSLLWPGAVAVAIPGKYVCSYFGNCLSTSSARFAPPLPLPLLSEDSPAGYAEEADLLEDPTPPPPPEVEELEEEEDVAEEED